MTLLGRMLAWLRRLKPAGSELRLVRKGERPEPQPAVDPLEELLRIVGEAEPGEPLSRGRPTSARRIRPRPR